MKYQKYVNELSELIKIKSISGEADFDGEVKKAADWLRNRLTGLGFESRVMQTSYNPVVYGEWLRAGEKAKTILIYGHYDVQSPEPLSEWKSDPFVPTIRNGNMYARGMADDKGQLYTWISAISELVKNNKLEVNVKFLIEGAEEVGSKGLDEFVKKNKQLLKADVCVLSDTHCLSESKPLITYGLRGLVYFDMVVSSLKNDVHSGIYGGNVLNPANELARMLTQMKDEKGEIKIPGFYDNVRQLGNKEKVELAKFPFTIENIKNETGACVVVGEEKRSIPERAGARPTLDVNGIWGGYSREGSKTIIPASAGAKVSMRLVPYQSSKEISSKFEKFVRLITPKGLKVEINELNTAEPVLLEKESEYFLCAEEAYKSVFGRKPLYELSGGSIGVVVDFKNVLGIDSVMMGYGLPDDGLHAPNEKMSLTMFEKGIETNMEFLRLVRLTNK